MVTTSESQSRNFTFQSDKSLGQNPVKISEESLKLLPPLVPKVFAFALMGHVRVAAFLLFLLSWIPMLARASISLLSPKGVNYEGRNDNFSLFIFPGFVCG